MKSTHKRAIRRDRRRAKASGWRREGKVRMGVVGHGPNGGLFHHRASQLGVPRLELVQDWPSPSLSWRPFAHVLWGGETP
jgi:hypothetical protein